MFPLAATGPTDPRPPPAPGEREACHDALPAVYDQLKRLAHKLLRAKHSFLDDDSTTIVHETWLRLARQPGTQISDIFQSLGVAASAMRQLLVDKARQRAAAKRGGGRPDRPLDEPASPFDRFDPDLLAVDEAVTRLGKLDERKARVVELRVFGGLSIEETAEVLGVSAATVRREWTLAKAWLRRVLGRERS